MSRLTDNEIMLLVKLVPIHTLGFNVRESLLNIKKEADLNVSLYCVGLTERLFFIEHYDSEPEKKKLVQVARQVMNGAFNYHEH